VVSGGLEGIEAEAGAADRAGDSYGSCLSLTPPCRVREPDAADEYVCADFKPARASYEPAGYYEYPEDYADIPDWACSECATSEPGTELSDASWAAEQAGQIQETFGLRAMRIFHQHQGPGGIERPGDGGPCGECLCKYIWEAIRSYDVVRGAVRAAVFELAGQLSQLV